MAVQYGRSDKKIDLSECFNGVQITSSEVCISQSCAEGWAVVFKKQPASVRLRLLFHHALMTC